jgi:hypothetical protein
MLLLLLLLALSCAGVPRAAVAPLSPAGGTFRGSNNWLSFCGKVNETKLLSSAQAQARQLLPFGYDIYGLDAGWSACASGDCNPVAPNFTDPKCCGLGHGMDAYGRPLPKPEMYPSSGPHGALGLKPIIDKVHAMGLRFQLRMERGIPIEAVQQKVPILGTNFTVDEIADFQTSCGKFGVTGGWGGSFAGINTSHPAALAYVKSVVDLWIEWGVDAIEADDYFGGQPQLPPNHPQTHGTNCGEYPYIAEIELLAMAIRSSRRPEMILSVMPGDGAQPSGGLAVSQQHWVTSYRVTPDFHADNGRGGGVCANPAGCFGDAGGEITLAQCNPDDKAQAWKWQDVGAASADGGSSGMFVMPFSDAPPWSPAYPTLKGELALSCRHDEAPAHNCQAGDDLDLWFAVGKGDNQVLNGSTRPTLQAPGTLSFIIHDEQTCASNVAGKLLMEDCTSGTDAQRWKLVPMPGVSGIVQIQSVQNKTECVVGGGGGGPAGANVNWPPQQQFAQGARFAHLIGLNGSFVNLDDLPAGHMTSMGCNPQTLAPCVWSEPQQRSVFTLYAMTRSPIMFSGDLPTDNATLKIVTNEEVLAIQEHSQNNRQLSNVAKCGSSNESYVCSEVIWVADRSDGDTDDGKYVAFFWTGSGNTTIVLELSQLGGAFANAQAVSVRDLWRKEDMPHVIDGSLAAKLGPHDVLLLRVAPVK